MNDPMNGYDWRQCMFGKLKEEDGRVGFNTVSVS